MPTPTLEPIATTTLASAAASITFGSIPNTFTDLRIAFSVQMTGNAYILCRFNAAATGYSKTYLGTQGTAASSGRTASTTEIMFPSTNAAATTAPQFYTLDVLSYAGSTNKTVLYSCQLDYNGTGSIERGVALWQSASAITQAELYVSGTTFAAGTTATLYGIKAA